MKNTEQFTDTELTGRQQVTCILPPLWVKWNSSSLICELPTDMMSLWFGGQVYEGGFIKNCSMHPSSSSHQQTNEPQINWEKMKTWSFHSFHFIFWSTGWKCFRRDNKPFAPSLPPRHQLATLHRAPLGKYVILRVQTQPGEESKCCLFRRQLCQQRSYLIQTVQAQRRVCCIKSLCLTEALIQMYHHTSIFLSRISDQGRWEKVERVRMSGKVTIDQYKSGSGTGFTSQGPVPTRSLPLQSCRCTLELLIFTWKIEHVDQQSRLILQYSFKLWRMKYLIIQASENTQQQHVWTENTGHFFDVSKRNWNFFSLFFGGEYCAWEWLDILFCIKMKDKKKM